MSNKYMIELKYIKFELNYFTWKMYVLDYNSPLISGETQKKERTAHLTVDSNQRSGLDK